MCRPDSRQNAVAIDSLSTVTVTTGPCLNRWRFWTTLNGRSNSVRPPWFDASRDRHIPALTLCLGVSANGAISILAPMSWAASDSRQRNHERRAVSGRFVTWARGIQLEVGAPNSRDNDLLARFFRHVFGDECNLPLPQGCSHQMMMKARIRRHGARLSEAKISRDERQSGSSRVGSPLLGWFLSPRRPWTPTISWPDGHRCGPVTRDCFPSARWVIVEYVCDVAGRQLMSFEYRSVSFVPTRSSASQTCLRDSSFLFFNWTERKRTQGQRIRPASPKREGKQSCIYHHRHRRR
jgi:hypothetical protein